MSVPATPSCPICGSSSPHIGTKRDFHFHRCTQCRFAFLSNPRTDYEQIYNEAYYRGQGADPLVDYVFELEEPERTIRAYEWRGIVEAVGRLRRLEPGTRWLDFGCGNGGLVRHARRHTPCEAVGFEEGWAAERGRQTGIPILRADELDAERGSFDIVTAIEVIEHVERPVEFLRTIHGLLKPGGLLFLTTGNAAPHAEKLLEWGYTTPEIHMSYFEPGTLAEALRLAGFEVRQPGFLPGFADIIRFKVLKNLGRRKREWWERLLPWSVLSRVVDARHRVSAHPCGVRRGTVE